MIYYLRNIKLRLKIEKSANHCKLRTSRFASTTTNQNLNTILNLRQLTFLGIDALEMCSLCFILFGLIAFFIYQITHLKRENKKLYRISKMALLEKATLQNQLNPHFVFNYMVRLQNDLAIDDSATAMENVTKFARFIRKTLNHSKRQIISLHEEIEQITSYLTLEKIRFPSGLDYEIKCSERLDPMSVQIPSLILQPLLERSVYFGYSKGFEYLKITIEIDTDDHDTIIRIFDSNEHADDYEKDAHPFNSIDILMDRIKLYNKFGIKSSLLKLNSNAPETPTGNQVELRFEIQTLNKYLVDDIQHQESIFI